jgi:hypothetical protein
MRTPTLLPEVRKALRRMGDPAKAPIMQAYMKSTMPYHGVPTPAALNLYEELVVTAARR